MVKAIIFDMDGTIVEYPNEPFHSSWDALADVLSFEKRKKWFKMRDFYFDRKISYDMWFNEQVGLLEGTFVSEVEKNFFPIPYSKGFESFYKKCDNGCIKGILSSGINLVAERIKEELKLDFQISNYLEVIDGRFTGKGNSVIALNDKVKFLYGIIKKYNLYLDDVCFVGDNFGDVPVLKLVGLPVAFKPKDNRVKNVVKYIIDDFNELEKILAKEKNQNAN